jgi:hypothetical protein
MLKTTLFAFNVGIAINFGRIYRYAIENGLIHDFLVLFTLIFSKNMFKNYYMYHGIGKSLCRQGNIGIRLYHAIRLSNFHAMAS